MKAGAGFGTHGHRDMEIVSYVLEGELQHKDSLDTGSVIRPGDVQQFTHALRPGRLQAARGELELNGQKLSPGVELLLFDLG